MQFYINDANTGDPVLIDTLTDFGVGLPLTATEVIRSVS